MIGVEMEVGKILTASLDIKSRATMAFALAHEINAPPYLKKAIKKVRDELQNGELIFQRNRAVHGVPFPSTSPDAVVLEMHRGKGGRRRHTVTNKELFELGQKIAAVTAEYGKQAIRYQKEEFAKRQAKLDGDPRLENIVENTLSASAEGEGSPE